MSSLIAGVIVIATFLLAATIILGTFINTSAMQGQSFKELTQVTQVRLGSAVTLTGATPTPGSGETSVAAQALNSGAYTVSGYGQMDVVAQYTDPDNNQVVSYLTYSATGSAAGMWTDASRSPDTFNPGLWDPGEALNLELAVSPEIKAGTSALLLVTTPQGASHQIQFSN